MLTGIFLVAFQGGLWRKSRLERLVITWVCSARTSSQIRILAPLSWRIRKQSVNTFGQPEPDDRVKGALDHQIGGFWANVNPSLYEHLELLQPCCHDNECYILPAAHCSGPAGRRTMRPGLKAGLLSISKAISRPHQALSVIMHNCPATWSSNAVSGERPEPKCITFYVKVFITLSHLQNCP